MRFLQRPTVKYSMPDFIGMRRIWGGREVKGRRSVTLSGRACGAPMAKTTEINVVIGD
jgi:hypothetical protein